jgi:thiol-disulfide isomerase/thioredoxin
MKSLFLMIVLVLLIKIQANAQDISVITNYNSISSSSQLFSRLKGKTIFLDLWAPWCEPCKEEFKYSDTLFKELKKRNIVVLYVSLNSNVNEQEWKADINKYNLKGFHVLSSKVLEDSLTKLIWGHSGGYSIPRYLLISPKGEILLNDALSPDHGSQLYDQIDQALKK